MSSHQYNHSHKRDHRSGHFHNPAQRKRKLTGRDSYKNSAVAQPLDLEAKVRASGGPNGYGLESSSENFRRRDFNDEDDERICSDQPRMGLSSGVFGGRSYNGAESFYQHERNFRSPLASLTTKNNSIPTSTRAQSSKMSSFRSQRQASIQSMNDSNSFPRTASAYRPSQSHCPGVAVHVVCALSENLARETCVASLDAGSLTQLQVSKQGNGQMYGETIAYLQLLRPAEVLLNEGRRNSPLARKVLDLYGSTSPPGRADWSENTILYQPLTQHGQQTQASLDGDNDDNEHITGRFGPGASTVVKFISRSYFDQTKGAELLRRVAREETYDAALLEEYIFLSSAYAVLHYTQRTLGASFARHCLYLDVHAGGNNRMTIDRSTLLQLELLVNSATGKVQNSLIGCIDHTKTTVGSRLLRTNLMAPPTRLDTINVRLDLVELFLESEQFFFDVFEHLSNLPDVDKMLTHVALVPRRVNHTATKSATTTSSARLAGKGIAALVCIKTALSALPAFASCLKGQLVALYNRGRPAHMQPLLDENASMATDRTSLLVGLGSGQPVALQRHHLLRSILAALSQPQLSMVLDAVNHVFVNSATYSRNAHTMKHQEIFALQSPEDGLMNILRQLFLANVDEIYKLADGYAELHGFQVRVKYTESRGYYLAIPAEVGKELPSIFLQPSPSGRFIHCTTEDVLCCNARAKDNAAELLVMTHLRIHEVMEVARAHYDALAQLCDAIALLDMCHSLADHVTLKGTQMWCRPVLTNDRPAKTSSEKNDQSDPNDMEQWNTLIIRNGRNAIEVAQSSLLGDDGPGTYIANDTFVPDDKRFTLVTGISGSGKSTYLRQVATIVILAQCGSFIPAEKASIPIRDRLLCRIGNADDQEHSISTFMLEMKETAFICNHSSENSLVLIDELGRATSNEDGVAIAWAVSEHLLKNRAITFFVTHYAQLSNLSVFYPCVQNIHLEASLESNQQNRIRYTHRVKAGSCSVSRNYGVELAAGCGWPANCVRSAREAESFVAERLPNDSLDLLNTARHNAADTVHSTEIIDLNEVLRDLCQSLRRVSFLDKLVPLPMKRNQLSQLKDRVLARSGGQIVLMVKLTDSKLPDQGIQNPRREEETSGNKRHANQMKGQHLTSRSSGEAQTDINESSVSCSTSSSESDLTVSSCSSSDETSVS